MRLCMEEIKDHVYPSGSRYTGGWKNGKKHGKGLHNYAEGGEYEGEVRALLQGVTFSECPQV